MAGIRARATIERRTPPRRLVATWLVVGIIIAAALIGLLLSDHGGGPAAPVTGTAVGNLAPDFALADTSGRPIALHQFRGRPVMIHFWAVDCTSCQAEQPEYVRAIASLGTAAPVVLAVDAWAEPAARIASYVRRQHMPGIALVDPDAHVFQAVYAGQGTPYTFYVDARGIIRQTAIGPQSYSEIVAGARAIGA